MLGGFVISYDGNRVTEQIKKSSKIWRFVQYLIINRYKTVTQEELEDVFCADEASVNPSGVVRTLVYRARVALAECGFPYAEDMILSSSSGGYRWNNAVSFTIDAEEFETLLKKASAENDPEERLKLIMEAAALYQGDFLQNASGELWVMPIARWYRTSFLSSVHEALRILTESGRIAEAEGLCARALRIDPLDETIIEYHLRSLLAQGKKTEAVDQYIKMESVFYDILGVTFSEELSVLNEQILRMETGDNAPLDGMMNKWLEGANAPGAYYCDANVFKTMYQIESRSAARSGRTAYIVSIDVKNKSEDIVNDLMTQLSGAIPPNLRKGDIYTRSGPRQYMIMLKSLTYENCKMLVDRILDSLSTKQLTKAIGTTIHTTKPA